MLDGKKLLENEYICMAEKEFKFGSGSGPSAGIGIFQVNPRFHITSVARRPALTWDIPTAGSLQFRHHTEMDWLTN